MIVSFFQYFTHYLVEVIPALIIGFFLSGLAHEFIPQAWVDKNLGNKGLKAVFMSTFIGALLPICCWGSLPVAVSFYKKGAKLGPVLAFLVATPATSISALLVTYRILGLKFAVFIFFTVIVMGMAIGMIGNLLVYKRRSEMDGPEICAHCHEALENCCHGKKFKFRILSVLRYAYWDMPKEIGLETLLGILLAAFVAAFAPFHVLFGQYLAGAAGYIFSLIFGLLMYICCTATVPLADAFIKQGLSSGAAMVLMLAGPITSFGTILVLRKEFGVKILLVYLSLVSIMSLAAGYIYSFVAR